MKFSAFAEAGRDRNRAFIGFAGEGALCRRR